MKHVIAGVFFFIGSVYSFNALAYGAANVGFSEYRLLLNKEQKHQSLTLFNKGQEKSKCEIGLSHYLVEEGNHLTYQKKPNDVLQPANKLIRFSPRRVIIDPKNSQKIKVSFRRKANLDDGEYISYLNLTCTIENGDDLIANGKMGAVISYNIPVHLRVGKLDATTRFELSSVNKNSDGYSVNVRQYRGGTRSLIGDINVIDIDSGDSIYKKTSIGFYRPAQYLDHKISLRNLPKAGIKIMFDESKEYGGSASTVFTVERNKF